MKILGIRFRLEIVIASILVGILAGCHLFCACTHTETAKKVVKEGLTNIKYNMSDGVKDSWGESRKVGDSKQQLNTHSGPKLPLSPGRLFFYADTDFKPECCVPAYSGASSSTGCACITEKQVNYINMRGGNNTCPSSI